MSEEAETAVDSALARRLIRLELSDVDLPRVAGETSQLGRAEVVFVRLLRLDDTLVVELWARGQPTGERRLTIAGNEQYQARRVALASAELGRRLREARLVERQRFLKQHLRRTQVASGAPVHTLRFTAGLAGGLRSAFWIQTKTLLLGPTAELWMKSEAGGGLALIAGAYSSATSAAPVGLRWTELGVQPSWLLRLSSGFGIGAGLTFGVGLLDLKTAPTLSSEPESYQTWGARLTASVSSQWTFARKATLLVEPEFGLHLRPLTVPVEATAGGPIRGAWAGLVVKAALAQ